MEPKDDEQTPEVVLAAGGVIWKHTAREPKIAVIHRRKYNDWSLPKGKIKEGETFKDAAYREAREETQCVVTVTDFAGSISYKAENKIKVVLFWNMVLEKETEFRETAEVDKVVWLTKAEALRKLSHPEQKQLLGEQQVKRRPLNPGFFRRLLVPKLRHQRLRGSLQAFRIEISNRIDADRLKRSDNLLWVAASEEALSAAEMALNEGDIDSGWKLLHNAQRLLIFHLNQEEVDTKAELLRKEAAEKLDGWRKSTINQLLPTKEDGQQLQISKAALFEATRVRDEHSDNLYYKIALLQNQIGILSVVLTVALSLLFVLAFFDRLPLDQTSITSSWETLASVMLFGILGGTISGAFSLVRTSTRSKITEQVADRLITLLRIAVGAGAALVVFALLRSAIFPKVFSFEVISPGTVYFLSFVAGFSERLVIKAVSSVVGK